MTDMREKNPRNAALRLLLKLAGIKKIHSGNAYHSSKEDGIPLLHGIIRDKDTKEMFSHDFIFIDNKWCKAWWNGDLEEWVKEE